MKLSEFYEKYGDGNINEKELKEFLGIKEHKHFKPKNGETYLFVGTDGNIYGDVWTDDEIDYKFYQNNELFCTEEEAEVARDENQFLLKMQRDFEDNSVVIDWDDVNQNKYFLYYDHYREEINIKSCRQNELEGPTYTTNKAFLENLIKNEPERVKKYLFGIGE